MKVYLCGDKGCCPSVEVTEEWVTIGEAENTCKMTREEWNDLKTKIRTGEI